MLPARVVFVCAGNTCRSPLAEALGRRIFGEHGLPVAVTSAGLAASAGAPAAPEARSEAAQRGLDLEGHRARRVEDVRGAGQALWLAMTSAQADRLRQEYGLTAQPLLAYARSLGVAVGPDDTLPDPLGRGPAAYAGIAATLEEALRGIAQAWAERAGQGGPEGAGGMQTKTIALPRLGGLTPTLESTALKLLEEAGELAEVIGKYRALSGERRRHPPQRVMTTIGQELLDVAQTAITMMFVLEEQYGVDLHGLLEEHVRKLAAKGYLEPAPQAPEAGSD